MQRIAAGFRRCFPLSVVRVNSRFVDKFFFSFLHSIPFFFGLEERTLHGEEKNKKKPNASCRFHGRFDEVRQADFFSFFVSISHTLTKRHTQQDRVFKKPMEQLSSVTVRPVSFELSSGFSFFLSFKLEKSTQRREKKKGKRFERDQQDLPFSWPMTTWKTSVCVDSCYTTDS